MSGVCASRTLPPPNNLPLDVNITASEKQNKSCLYFQAKILPEVKSTLVDHMRFYARPIVIAILSFY